MIQTKAASRYEKLHEELEEGQIFSLKASEPITIQITPTELIYESNSAKGMPFVEYDYEFSENSENYRSEWIRYKPKKQRYEIISKRSDMLNRSYTKHEHTRYLRLHRDQIPASFHLILIGEQIICFGIALNYLGLDRMSFTAFQMSSEIHLTVSGSIGPIDPSNIIIIETESIICKQNNSLALN